MSAANINNFTNELNEITREYDANDMYHLARLQPLMTHELCTQIARELENYNKKINIVVCKHASLQL